jgi:putative ABC transport system ATP-binding protein
MSSVLQLNDVWKKYDMGHAGTLVVLREIMIDIKKGDFVAITGPSGSGKSTMMNIIGALDKPSWGRVLLNGTDIEDMNESSLAFLRGRTIGFIFQQFNLIPTLTAMENVMLPMEMINANERMARLMAKELLEMLGLGDRLYHKPTELSGGQQQRVAIARALANDPEIILADEPTGNLDSHTGEFVINFLSKLNKEGKTVILISHDLNLVKFANRVIYIKDGRVEKEVVNSKRGKK